MKRLFTLLISCLLVSNSFSQFNIGSTTITFNDPARTGGFGSGGGPGRQIQCEVYYPSSSTGVLTPIINDSFPVIVFGHGFVMTWDAYQNIWERLVPEGYIMVFPRTEGSLSPSHTDFGLDLAIVEQRMQLENSLVSSFFYNHIKSRSAIMGHSMGGGSTILAAQSNSNIKTIVCLAPAETSPSAINVASLTQVPALILSGSNDGVTPPATNHQLIYDSIQTCKTFLSLPGGGHCYFANSNFNCDFGEASSSTGITLTRAEQQDISEDYYSIWFDFYLKQNCNAFSQFQDSLLVSTRVIEQQSCSYASPILSSSITASTTGSNGSIDLTVSGGQSPFTFSWTNSAITEDISSLSPGTYTVTVTDDYGCSVTQTFSVGTVSNITNITDYLNEIMIYPNPFNQYFALKNEYGKLISIKLSNIEGKILAQYKTKDITTTIGENIEKGIYLLSVFNEDNILVKYFKIVKN